MQIIDNRPFLEKQNYDVIVVGGGIAGVAAAVSASRHGAKVLLMEKGIVLGGLATIGLISWYEPLCDHLGNKMISGIAEELIKLSMKYGFDSLPDAWKDGENKEKVPIRYATFYSPTIFSMALDEYITDSGAKMILDCMAVFPVMEGNKCIGVAAETKEGRVFYGAKYVVDATGDASLYAQAGLPTVSGTNYLTYWAHGYSAENIHQYEESETKSMNTMRKWRKAGSNMVGVGHPEGFGMLSGTTSEEITSFVLTGRKMLFEQIKDQGRNERDISMLPMMPQFRTIRHMVGEYDFQAVDREYFEDTIGSCGDFRKVFKGNHYHVPFRSLYSAKCPNMIAAGRNISASGNGWEATRVIPVCALTGQAAGTAAALATKTNCDFTQLDVSALQQLLKQDGVLFNN